MSDYMPVAGKLKLKCLRFPYSSSSTHDLASTKLMYLLNTIEAEAIIICADFRQTCFLEALGHSAVKVKNS